MAVERSFTEVDSKDSKPRKRQNNHNLKYVRPYPLHPLDSGFLVDVAGSSCPKILTTSRIHTESKQSEQGGVNRHLRVAHIISKGKY